LLTDKRSKNDIISFLRNKAALLAKLKKAHLFEAKTNVGQHLYFPLKGGVHVHAFTCFINNLDLPFFLLAVVTFDLTYLSSFLSTHSK